MTDNQYYFYECNNQNCGLRFPGYSGAPKWNRCPVCRGRIHIVAHVDNTELPVQRFNVNKYRKVEVLLDNIRSAWNVGSIFRTSDGIGISKIYLCGISPTPDNPKVGKTALGAESNIAWEHFNNGVNTARDLKSRGHALMALEDLPEAIPLFQMEIPAMSAPLILIAGNEICGVDPGIIELCDKVISIPMLGMKRSYNVAIAFGIAASLLTYKINPNNFVCQYRIS